MHKKLSSALVISAVLACLLGSPGFMAAQGNTWVGINLEQMVNAARFRLGALRLNASLELTNAGYDSDVYYGYFDEAVPDYTFSAGLPVQILLPLSKKVVLEVSDTPQYLFFLDTQRERAWNNTFQGALHLALDEIYIQAGGRSANVRRRFSPELDVNVREKTNGLNGLALWQLSRMTSLALIYEGAEYRYSDAEYLGTNISELLDRREDFFDFVTYVQPGPRTRLFADGQFGTYRFAATEAANRNAKSYAFFGGVEFIPRTGEVLQRIGARGTAAFGLHASRRRRTRSAGRIRDHRGCRRLVRIPEENDRTDIVFQGLSILDLFRGELLLDDTLRRRDRAPSLAASHSVL